MKRYLDPKSDLVFKKIFGNHPKLLKSFLNALLPLPTDGLIETIEYLPTENVPEIPEFKYSIVDVRCFDKKRRHFIVEMQMSWSRHYIQRFLFNTASVYVRQLGKGMEYRHLSPVYGLSLVDAMFSEETDCFHHYQLTHAKNNDLKIDDIHLVLLELPKFKPTTLKEKKLAILWLRFMTEIDEHTREVDAALNDVPEIREALALTEEAAYTPQELDLYNRNWDAIRTETMRMDDKFEDGFEKGIHQVAINLLRNGNNIEFVAQNTGLSFETILRIQASMQ